MLNSKFGWCSVQRLPFVGGLFVVIPKPPFLAVVIVPLGIVLQIIRFVPDAQKEQARYLHLVGDIACTFYLIQSKKHHAVATSVFESEGLAGGYHSMVDILNV
ncbi:hypothetical protein L9G15_07730 [Shewanella sp. A3A]|nr:hypothetical protein [Shewanella ferrihydritica]